MAFRKIGKFEERSSKILEIRKFENIQMNDANIPKKFKQIAIF